MHYEEKKILAVMESIRQGSSSYRAGQDFKIPVGTIDAWIRKRFGNVGKLRRKRNAIN